MTANFIYELSCVVMGHHELLSLESPGTPWNPIEHPLEFLGPPGTTWDKFGSYIASAQANARGPGDPVGHLGPKKCAHGQSQDKCKRLLQ